MKAKLMLGLGLFDIAIIGIFQGILNTPVNIGTFFGVFGFGFCLAIWIDRNMKSDCKEQTELKE